MNLTVLSQINRKGLVNANLHWMMLSEAVNRYGH